MTVKTSHTQAAGQEKSELDIKQTIAIWFNHLTLGVYLTLPYTLAVYMVRHFEGTSGNEKLIGRNTGLLAATASAAQFTTSFLWGSISDRVGRKPVAAVGNISACLSVLALGLAPTFGVAVLSRFVGGLFTSATGVAIQTIIGESYDAKNQAKVMGFATAGWAVGSIGGPTIGGLLARPCDNFASSLSICHEGCWFFKRPFLLPCLVSAVGSALAWLMNLFLLSESHPQFQSGLYAKLSINDDEPLYSASPLRPRADQADAQEVQMSQLQIAAEPSSAAQPLAPATSQHGSQHKHTDSDAESETEGLLLHQEHSSSQDDEEQTSSEEERQHHVVNVRLPEESDRPWYKQNILRVCLCAGALIVACTSYLDELAPIFASAHASAGGLHMPEKEFALPLTFGGAVLMLYSLFLYPRTQKRYGQLTCCKIGLLLVIPASWVFPASSMFSEIRWLTQAFMFVAVGIRSVAKIMALSSSTIIVNTIAPKAQIGAVNGASQSLKALARATGPLTAGTVWGLSASSGIPGKQYLPFMGSTFGVLLTFMLYSFIVLPSK